MAIRLLGEDYALKYHSGKVEEFRKALQRGPGRGKASMPLLVGLRGRNPYQMALLSDCLLSDGHRLALIPCELAGPGATRIEANLDVQVDLDLGRLAWSSGPSEGDDDFPPFDVAYFTSGSTSQPKAVGVTVESLRLTADWYRLIYRLDTEAAILTCMPFSYNFTFAAAFCQARFTGTRLGFATAETIHELAMEVASQGRRTVLLANPIVLERFLNLRHGRCRNLLIDSGGAPLSRYAVEKIRETVGDLREGYGLCETCSLTHFDLVGDHSSLGTVGQPMPGVRTDIREDPDGKPCVWIQSPNACRWLEAGGIRAVEPGAMMRTGDLGTIDRQGNLRLLARSDDIQIHGLWPRDTLNAIGPALGVRCALVQHKDIGPRVRIRLKTELSANRRKAVVKRASEFLGLPDGEIGIQANGGPMLHSLKLPRT